jgi:hypothetical protein
MTKPHDNTAILLLMLCALWPDSARGAAAFVAGASGQTPSTRAVRAAASVADPSEAQARQMLAAAQEEAKSASAVVRAKVWLEVAKQLLRDGKKTEERSLLGDAYLATLEIPPVHNNFYWLVQAEILRTMMKDLGPAPVEETLPQMDANMRGIAYDLLVTRYIDDQNWDRAVETLKNAPQNQWFPFAPALRLLGKLPPQRVADRRVIVGLEYYICDGKRVAISGLTLTIEQFWRDFAREQVVDAIPKILKEAMRADMFPVLRPVKAYENSKSKLLPILKELDPAKAQEWERGEKQAWEDARKAGMLMIIDRGEYDDPPAQNVPASPAHVPVKNVPTAQASSKPRVVNGCMEDEPWCDENRISHALEALEGHLKRGELELAKQSVSRGYRLALGEWKLDTDPADPNQVHKPAWRSTENWEAFTVLATKISPQYALERAKQIPDPEIRLLTRVMLARMWLGEKPEFTPCQELVSDYHRDGDCVHYSMYMPRELFQWVNY